MILIFFGGIASISFFFSGIFRILQKKYSIKNIFPRFTAAEFQKALEQVKACRKNHEQTTGEVLEFVVLYDSATCHTLPDELLARLEGEGVQVAQISGGLTALVQPLDGPPFRSLKAAARRDIADNVFESEYFWDEYRGIVRHYSTPGSFHRCGFGGNPEDLNKELKALLE